MSRREAKLLAFDTEDNSNGEVSIINFFDGDRHTTFTGRDLQVEAWNWLATQAPAICWACMTEYDLVNLCGPWIGKMATLNYRGSAGLLRASWRDAKVQFFDTLRHWPMSVAQMGRYIGLPKLERDFQSVKYCRRDTEIVWLFVEHMLRRYREMGLQLRATLPSMALQLFKQFYGKEWPQTAPEDRAFFRQGYYGGRVEVYQFGRIKGPVYHYDVNSLFPSVMSDGVYPNVEAGYTRTSSPDWQQEGMADITILVPETRYPCLPVRGGDELLYPHGLVRGTWPYPEIRSALLRGAKILAVHEATQYRPLPPGEPFKNYVIYCYKQRRKATHELDRVYWKLMMNSLYGKFGQGGEGLITIYNDLELIRPSTASHANVIWAAYVTAQARVRLLGFLESTRLCYYTDTDSLFTPHQMPTSMRLGKLKWEGTAGAVQFYGNKLYVLYDYATECGQCKGRGTKCTKCHGKGHLTKAEVIKAKGVPPEAASDFIRTGRAVFRKPIRLRESRHNFLAANIWLVNEKERDDLYTKRRVFGNGSTWAWQWNLYQRVRTDDVLSDMQRGTIGLARTSRFDVKMRRREVR